MSAEGTLNCLATKPFAARRASRVWNWLAGFSIFLVFLPAQRAQAALSAEVSSWCNAEISVTIKETPCPSKF